LLIVNDLLIVNNSYFYLLGPLLPRGGHKQKEVVMLKIYEDLYEISFNDKTLELTPKEYELLKILIKESNKLLSKSELRELLWPKKDLKSRVVDTYISRVRKKLKIFGHPGIMVQSKRGYRLINVS